MLKASESSSLDLHAPAIALDGVGVDLEGAAVLHGLTFSVNRGEFMLVLGPNGAGKTTLLKAINGLIPATRGTVRIYGELLSSSSVKSLRKRIAFLPQDVDVDTRIPINVRDVVGIGRLAHKPVVSMISKEDRKIVDGAMELVGVTGLARRPFGRLSAGQKQKVALARALSQQADIMLLDEPLSNLDPRAQQDVCDTIDSIHRETSTTVLLVTHMLETVPRAADRAVLMKGGTFAGKVDIEQVYDDRFRRSLYSGLAGDRASSGKAGAA
jgi:ABC-type cobalamin/Fe3+-siderophores transport system ATPase subunit